MFFFPKSWLQYACSQLCFWKLCPPPWRKQVFQGCSTGIAPENIPGPKKETGSSLPTIIFSGASCWTSGVYPFPVFVAHPCLWSVSLTRLKHQIDDNSGIWNYGYQTFLWERSITTTSMKPPCMDQRCLESQALLSGNLPFRGSSILPAKSCCTYHPAPISESSNGPMHRRRHFLSVVWRLQSDYLDDSVVALPHLLPARCSSMTPELLSGRIWKARLRHCGL